MRSVLRKQYVLPLFSALVSFALYQLALHDPLNARTFSSLSSPLFLEPSEFGGVYVRLAARFVDSILHYPALSFRLLTAIATGCSVYFIQRLFPRDSNWSFDFVIANIFFLYFACHSLSAMIAIMSFAACLFVLNSDDRRNLPLAALIATVGLGIDPLIASALLIYVVMRQFLSHDGTKNIVITALCAALGVTAWLLLAFMLFGSNGFADSIASGFSGLFTQTNPINFGIGVLLTFNLLLYWLFRSPAETTRTRYLGSLLIILFLFVRVEPVHLVMLLMTGVLYLYNTGGLPKRRWVLPVYAAANVLSFFILPNLSPLESSYNIRAERPGEALAYTVEYFAKNLPAFQALTRKSEMLEQAETSLLHEKSRAPVILDPALETAFDAAALRHVRSSSVIGGFNVAARRFKTVDGHDTSMVQSVRGWPYFRYIATDALPRPIDSMLHSIQAPRSDHGGLRFYTVDSSHFDRFIDAYIFHHYISFH